MGSDPFKLRGRIEEQRDIKSACVHERREVNSMRAIVTVLVILAALAAISIFDFSGIVTPIAKAAILLVPITFTVSLVIGFAWRRSWFR